MADLRASAGATVLIVVLSLATWMVFYKEEMPLDLAGTAVIAGAWALAVFLGRWSWLHFRKGSGEK